MSGYEVCRRIREDHAATDLPIIILSAKNLVRDLTEGFEAGANDYVVKPMSAGELVPRVNTDLNLAKINVASGRFVPRDFLTLLGCQRIVT